MKGLLWKLLKKHVSKSQMFGFALANIIGLTIVLLGVQFYQDVRNIFADEDSFMRKDYLVVTKRVGELNAIATMMGGGANTFTDNELTQLRNEPWVRDVGEFSTSNYQVYGTISLAGQSVSLRSSFFFEAVPDKFLDVKSKDWHFDPEHPQIPIIVSKDYLSLYNFGFAASQGMPQMSENMIGMVPIVFRLTGNNGTQDYLEGRIVGFSNRLNTIIVPQSFMDWSNKRYAPNADSQASRRILYEFARLRNCRRQTQQQQSKPPADNHLEHRRCNRAGHLRPLVLHPYLEHLPALAKEHAETPKPAAVRLLATASVGHVRAYDCLHQHCRLCAFDSGNARCSNILSSFGASLRRS